MLTGIVSTDIRTNKSVTVDKAMDGNFEDSFLAVSKVNKGAILSLTEIKEEA